MTTPTRPWYRIHLSTVVVVLLLAAVLITVNVMGRQEVTPVTGDPSDYCTVVKRGWPLTYHYTVYHRKGLYSGDTWFYSSLIKDAALIVGILLAETCAWESLMRLRDKRMKM
jgi:hypothetical protein